MYNQPDIKVPGKEKIELRQITRAFVNRFKHHVQNFGVYYKMTERERYIIRYYNEKQWLSKEDVAKHFQITKTDIHFLFNRCRSNIQIFLDNPGNRDLLVDFVLKEQNNPCVIAAACDLPKHQISDWLRKRK